MKTMKGKIGKMPNPRNHQTAQSDKGSDLQQAEKAISLQIKVLQILRSCLDEHIIAAADMMEAADRICVTGVGKSGIIARKIAATLSSLGQPAYFVHPTDAGHGDLGMIAANDVCLILSKSGQTYELESIMSYCRSRDIPMIAISQSKYRTFDLVLPLPSVPEAHVTQAPTTSTTAMLAYGDALAVILASRKQFTTERFRTLHPGGTLGASNGANHHCQASTGE